MCTIKRGVLSLIFSVLLFLPSCEEQTILSIDQTDFYPQFLDTYDSQSITLTANKPWTASSNQSWCKVSPSSGEEATNSKITITCEANTTYDSRECYVTITCAELAEKIYIHQAANNGFVLSQTSYEVTKAAQQLNIEVKANVDYYVAVDSACKDWISYKSTKGLTSSTIVLDIAENKSYTVREGKVVLKQLRWSGDTNDPIEETIVIKQEEGDAILVENSEFTISPIEQTLSFGVQSNVDYEVVSKTSWISSASTKAMQSSTVTLNIQENPNSSPRSGSVILKYQKIEHIINITQKQKYSTDIAYPSQEASFISQTLKNSVRTNTPLKAIVPPTDSWISVSLDLDYSDTERPFYYYYINIVLEENTGKRRLSTITLYSEDEVALGTIEIAQSGKEDMIVVTLDEATRLEASLSEYDISTITSLKITGMVTEIDELFLHKMTNLFVLDLSETNMTAISKEYFKYFRKLTYIYLPAKLQAIGTAAFQGCSSLLEIVFPQSLSGLSSSAFQGCTSLKSVSFQEPSSLGGIPPYVFYDCSSLQSITIPSSVKSIGYGAFSQCANLESITFSEGLETIQSPPHITGYYFANDMSYIWVRDTVRGAFANCIKLRSLSFPSSLKTIGEGSFYRCSALSEVNFGVNSSLEIIGGIRTGDQSQYGGFYEANILFGAFSHCSSLTTIQIPKSLKTIEVGAFYGCTALENVNFDANSEVNFGSFAFSQTAIKEIIFPAGIKSIGDAFSGCKRLEKVSFAKGSLLERIGGLSGTNIKEFDASNCTHLTSCKGITGSGVEIMKIGAIKPPEAGNITLASYSILYVPSESISDYQRDSFWNKFSTIKPL